MQSWILVSFLLTGLAAITATAVAVVAVQRRPAPGAGPFAVLMVAIAWWSLGSLAEAIMPNVAAAQVATKFQYFGIVTVPPAYLLFALSYTRQRVEPGWLLALSLFAIPAVTLGLAWTNEWHGLIWQTVEPVAYGPFLLFSRTYGLFFWVFATYSYVLNLISTVLLLRYLRHSGGIFEAQTVAILIGAIAPWLGNALYLARIAPVQQIDLTPVAFSITGLAFTYALFRYRLLDLVPVAHDAVVQHLPDAVFVLNARDEVVALNPAAEAIVGTPSSIVAGRPIDQVLALYPKLIERLDTDAVGNETVYLTVGGTEHCYEIRTAELQDSRGDLTGRILVLRDESDRQRAQDEHLRLLDERAARREADAALRTRDEVLSTISHDLKNPLAAITMSAAHLQRRYLSGTPQDLSGLAEGLSRIEGLAHRMSGLLDELVEASRLQRGHQLELDKQPTDLLSLVEASAAAQQAAGNPISIVPSAQPTALVAFWDPVRLERVIGNLLSNASKYSPPGRPVTIELHRREEPNGPWAELLVKDQGYGIPEADLPRIFDWYFRGGNVVGQVSGTGIGLASSHRIVEQHGGTLSASSVEGFGSVFTVRLPLYHETDAGVATQQSRDLPAEAADPAGLSQRGS